MLFYLAVSGVLLGLWQHSSCCRQQPQGAPFWTLVSPVPGSNTMSGQRINAHLSVQTVTDSNTHSLLVLSGSGVPCHWDASFGPVHHPGEPVEQPSPRPVHHPGEGPLTHGVAVLHPARCHACAAVHQLRDDKHQRGGHLSGRRTRCEGRRELRFQGDATGYSISTEAREAIFFLVIHFLSLV